ncbi:hypothetical protein QE364_002199 [Nocardioides zeae]|uniref:Uncharacterized protein n=2 Tax=Nocardioides zeae TaxID=1457234 RepID=A0AAJ1TX83_9ACTN|nr:hypothetical protein [Nocardioides zeae]MDQ1103966.1 hypothetical protein [Nocardioides zeae]MDR6176342.1 hypothetical protein [Nocardioides zeae]MDR6210488.1 hypothetical protein [Nocardioides zeae]
MNAPPPLERVAERLGLAPDDLAYLGRFDDAQLDALDTAVAMAQHREDLEVRRGMRDAVRLVPAPLRRRVAATLFPRDGAAEPSAATGASS